MSTRSLKFRQHAHNRFWWHRALDTDYVPIPYSLLSDAEWELMQAWFDDTGVRYRNPGEANVPPLSMLVGLISGNGIQRIVQCGHYAGYSTLLLGFLLRQMGHKSSLYSIDIDDAVTAYTASWVKRCGLDAFVHLEVSDSAQSDLPAKVTRHFGGKAPQIVFIDSSDHVVQVSLREAKLCRDVVTPGAQLGRQGNISRIAGQAFHKEQQGIGSVRLARDVGKLL